MNLDIQQKSKIWESPLKTLGGQPIWDLRFEIWDWVAALNLDVQQKSKI